MKQHLDNLEAQRVQQSAVLDARLRELRLQHAAQLRQVDERGRNQQGRGSSRRRQQQLQLQQQQTRERLNIEFQALEAEVQNSARRCLLASSEMLQVQRCTTR